MTSIDPKTKIITAPIIMESSVPNALSFFIRAIIDKTKPATPRPITEKTGKGINENCTWAKNKRTKARLRKKPHLPNRERGRKVIFMPTSPLIHSVGIDIFYPKPE
jgi:hypothetical protein